MPKNTADSSASASIEGCGTLSAPAGTGRNENCPLRHDAAGVSDLPLSASFESVRRRAGYSRSTRCLVLLNGILDDLDSVAATIQYF